MGKTGKTRTATLYAEDRVWREKQLVGWAQFPSKVYRGPASVDDDLEAALTSLRRQLADDEAGTREIRALFDRLEATSDPKEAALVGLVAGWTAAQVWATGVVPNNHPYLKSFLHYLRARSDQAKAARQGTATKVPVDKAMASFERHGKMMPRGSQSEILRATATDLGCSVRTVQRKLRQGGSK